MGHMKASFYSFLVLLFSFGISATAQTINTVAGNGTAGFTGDGAAATLAELYHPKGAFVDAAGNVYIADADNNRIRKVSTSGIISTVAGTGIAGYAGDGFAATVALLNRPDGVWIDAAGNLYISDADNSVIRKVNSSGIISTIVGDGTPGYTGDGGPATAAEINLPSAIAFDAAGNLYIADEANNLIRKVNTSGTITTYAGTGLTGYSGEGGPATAADIGFPYGLAVDGAGNVYVSLYFDNRVCKINVSTGIITTVAGNGTAGFTGDGGPATAAEMEGNWGIAADAAGNVFIADNVNERIRWINPAGTITTLAGNGSAGFIGDGGPATAARLRDPVGVAVGPGDAIYVADYNNHRLRRVGALFTHAPTFTAGHSQTMTLCMSAPATSINSMMAISDLDTWQGETWTVVLAPAHGTVAASYTAVSTGGVITPTGLIYTPAAGYTGTDSFKVSIADGTAADITTVLVTINSCITRITPSVVPNALHVFPNPNSGVFALQLQANSNEEMQVTITDMMGRKVLSLTAAANELTNIQMDQPNGIYFISATTAHGRWNEKITISK
jgi:hypothetical protein